MISISARMSAWAANSLSTSPSRASAYSTLTFALSAFVRLSSAAGVTAEQIVAARSRIAFPCGELSARSAGSGIDAASPAAVPPTIAIE